MTTLKTSLAKRYKLLFESRKYTDCEFIVEDSTFPCHKLVLSMASPVFESMLYGDLKETSIEIKDLSAESFYSLLEFMYTNELSLENKSMEDLIEIYYGAHKYFLDELSDICLAKIKTILCLKYALPALDLSISLGIDKLEDILLSFVKEYCLVNDQFKLYMESNYYHASIDCINRIIVASNTSSETLEWYINTWCEIEKGDISLDTMNPIVCPTTHEEQVEIRIKKSQIHRGYYKASSPFEVSKSKREVYTTVKSDRFIVVHGVVIRSRLFPCEPYGSGLITGNEYVENFTIKITDETSKQMIHKQEVNQKTLFNLETIFELNRLVTFEPQRIYKIMIIFHVSDDQYPTCIQSNSAAGLHFQDMLGDFGGIIRGLQLSYPF